MTWADSRRRLRPVRTDQSPAAGSRRRLHCEKLAVAYGYEAARERGIRLHQCDERGHLRRVRRGVVDDQQASRAQNATQVRPPARIFGALGIEEDQVVCARITLLQNATRVVANQGDEW